jgi:iron complex outermembrane recepter protein
MNRLRLFLASVSTIAWASTALAQSAPATDGEMSDIVVTAQRKSQNLQDVPVTITALSADTLRSRGALNTFDLAQNTTSLVFAGASSTLATVFMRGLGDSSFNSNAIPSVGFYLDDAYMGSSFGLNQALLDLDRVEVLKGPQGTLYGKNTTGGAIRFITRKPDPSEPVNGTINLSGGSFGEVNADAAIGAPLSDTTAVRIAAGYHRQNGPFRNLVTGDHGPKERNYALRGSLLSHLTPELDMLLSVHGSRNRGDSNLKEVGAFTGPFSYMVCDNPTLGGGCPDTTGFVPSPNKRDYYADAPDMHDIVRNIGGSATLTWQPDSLSITSVTAYDRNSRNTRGEIDWSPADLSVNDIYSKSRQISQEVRIASDDKQPISWLLGGYFFHDRLTSQSAYSFRGFGPGFLTFGPNLEGAYTAFTQKTRSLAAFGEVYWKVADTLKLTAGLRYSQERKGIDLALDFLNIDDSNAATVIDRRYAASHVLVANVATQNERRTWDNLSGRATIDYDPADNVKLFFTFSRGFRAGTFNGGVLFGPDEVATVNPETVTNYEFGWKTDLIDRTLRFNGALYHTRLTNQQVFVPGIVLLLENAATSRVNGAEVSLTWKPVRAFQADLGAAYTDARFRSYSSNLAGADYSGNRLPYAPRWTLNGSLSYTAELAGGNSLSFQTDGSYRSRTFFSVAQDRNISEKSVFLLNGRVNFAAGEKHWSVSVYAKNIFNRIYFKDGFDQSGIGFNTFAISDPRRLGASVQYSF